MNTRTKISIQEPSLPIHNNGANGAHSEKKFAVLSVVGPLMPGITPKVQPFESVDQGTETFLSSRIESQERQRDEILTERQADAERLKQIEKWPKRDWIANTAIILALAGLLFLSLFSWLNGAQFVAMNFSDTYWEGLLFCSVIPAIPFILKYLLNRFASKTRTEFILAGLFLLGFFVFVDQFALHFAKKEELSIPTQQFDFGLGNQTSEVTSSTVAASVSLRWFFYGQLILECVGSYVFFTWLIHLLAIRRNPLWELVHQEIQTLTERVVQFDSELAELNRKLGELRHRKAAYQTLTSALNELFK